MPTYKRVYSIRTSYRLFTDALRSFPAMLRGKRGGALSAGFRERIMLAVTEVNGCAVCSWAHTRMALDQGFTPSEIRNLLSGNTDEVPVSEAVGIVFAQHYADSRGNPSREAWSRLMESYGPVGAKAILGAARFMMTANAHGIALSAFLSRIQGRPVQHSSLLYEGVMTVIPVLFLPFSLVHAGFAALCRFRLIQFQADSAVPLLTDEVMERIDQAIRKTREIN
jgi:AhpD family alkylhydroperoxidase